MRVNYRKDADNIKKGGGVLMKKYIIVIIALLLSFLGVNMLFAAPDTWTQRADFGGTARSGAVGFSIGSKGYIGMGWDIDGYLRKDFWEYEPSAGLPWLLLLLGN